MTDTAPASRQAFRELLDLLREVGDTHFVPQRGVIDAVTGAEAYRFVLHLRTAGTEHHLEGDPARPMFTRVVSPQRKLLGDNPDAKLVESFSNAGQTPSASAISSFWLPRYEKSKPINKSSASQSSVLTESP